MSVSDRLLLRKRAIIETVNDELKNIAQVEHSGHRCFDNFIVNLLGVIAAYCLFPKKPRINVQRAIDTQLTLFWIRRTHVIYLFYKDENNPLSYQVIKYDISTKEWLINGYQEWRVHSTEDKSW